MSLFFQRQLDVSVQRGQVWRRRDVLKAFSLAALAQGCGWTDFVLAQSDQLRAKHKACILLWMQGGPSQFETFSPKPGTKTGGPTQAISTAVPGIEIASGFEQTAKMMRDLTILRTVSTKEGAHPRATFLMHTGYVSTPAVKFPALGSVVSHARDLGSSELPAYVRIGNPLGEAGGAGFLGADHDPMLIRDPSKPPQDAKPLTSVDRYHRRMNLVADLDQHFAAQGAKQEVADHQKLYRKVERMITSPKMKAFELSDEPTSVREAYGSGDFAASCLLARRLVEWGIPFVEVVLKGWDTHTDNFKQSAELVSTVDRPFAQLIRDLKERGLWDSTLVVWMGEFGRSPGINPNEGRDHFSKAFNVVLGGGGIQGGQVIGKTDPSGNEITDRPISVQDLFQTLCKSLELDPDRQSVTSTGRPVKVVDGGQPIAELFS